jgi:hypothetical protein
MVATLAAPSDAARRESLNGNVLIHDGDDIYLYPQLSLDYVNLVRFKMGVNDTSGEGRFVFGTKTFAMVLSANRSDIAPYGDGNNAFAQSDPTPWTVADLTFGFKMGEKGKLGFRLYLGNGGESSQADAADGATGSGQFAAGLAVGYSMTGEKLSLDLGLHIGLHTLGDISNGTDNQSGSNIHVSLGGRGFLKIDEELSIGMIAGVGINSNGHTTYVGSTANNASKMNWNINLGAGPVYTIKDKAKIAGYVTLGFGGQSVDPSDIANDDESSTTAIVIPGLLLSAEVLVLKWLYTRFGVGYDYRVEMGRNEASETDTTKFTGSFKWTAGVGFKVGDFNFDGSLTQEFFTNGPAFLGQDGALFGQVAARYRF